MKISEEIRTKFLVLTCLGVFFTIGKLSFDSNAANRTVKEYAFPTYVPLTGDKILESDQLPTTIQQPKQYESIIASRHYRYLQNGIPLDINIHYVVGTLGNVAKFVKEDNKINIPEDKIFKYINTTQNLGFYGTFVYRNQAYLSSCINSRGGSTVTPEQFIKNRYRYDLNLNHFQSWLFGNESLLDRRCLLVNLSTPINKTNPISSYQFLEKAWFSCYKWWSSHFPES